MQNYIVARIGVDVVDGDILEIYAWGVTESVEIAKAKTLSAMRTNKSFLDAYLKGNTGSIRTMATNVYLIDITNGYRAENFDELVKAQINVHVENENFDLSWFDLS